MGPVRIGVGTEWLVDGRAWRVVRQLSEDRLVAIDQQFHSETEFRRQQVLDLYQSGSLTFLPNETVSRESGESPHAGQDIRDLTPELREEVERRWRLIEPLTRVRGSVSESDVVGRVEELQQTATSTSRASLWRYYKAWKDSGGDRRALMPGRHRCGGRGRPKRSSFTSRYPLIGRLIDEALRDVYLTTARRPISAVTRRVLDDLQRVNSRLPSDKTQPIPKERTLSRAIARRIQQMDPWEVDRQRWGHGRSDALLDAVTARTRTPLRKSNGGTVGTREYGDSDIS